MERDKIRALLDISVEAVDYIQSTLSRGEDDPDFSEIMDNLRQIAGVIETETCGFNGILQKVYLYARNIQASMDEIQRDLTVFERVFSFEIRPFVLEMNRLWRLAADVLSDGQAREHYQQGLMQAMRELHSATQENYLYDATIVLCAYNKLEYTRLAVESIFAHTDFSSGRVELITINNGSEDGTREYFESLPHTKKINLKYNILGFNAALYIVEGKHYVGYSNDVVATPHWLEHLIMAMESDEHIAMAVPTCNEESISNLQGIPVPYPNTFEGMEEMQEFAAAHNCLNPALWEERSVLMPFLSITRMDIYKMGLVDPIYTRGEFVDDDLSTLLRRTGWRQLLLKDTFMHHFGGVTLGEGRRKEPGNALDEMRRVYYEKWGVDAWDSRGSFCGIEYVWPWYTFRANEHVLILEPRFGGLACDLLNEYRRSGFVPSMTAALFDRQYVADTDCLFNAAILADSIANVAAQSVGKYDIISAGCYLDELPLRDVIDDLEQLYALLAPGGLLILPVRNPGSAYEMDRLIQNGVRDVYAVPGEVRPYVGIPYRQLLHALYAHPFLNRYKIQSIVMGGDISLAERFKPLLRIDEDAPPDLERSLSIRMFFLGIFKE